MGAGDYITGLMTPSSTYQLNDVVGCEEISSTHPYQYLTSGVPAEIPNTLKTKLDIDPFPRAILSKVWSYNFEHNLPAVATGSDAAKTAAKIRTANAYFGGTVDPIGSAATPFYFGGVAMPAGNGDEPGDSGDTVAYTVNFPAMGMCVTPSIAQYKGC